MPIPALSWLAVRSEAAKPVARAIGLKNAKACSWSRAQEITRKHGVAVFVSPPVSGWVFVAGLLPFEATQPSGSDPLLAWMRKLSETFSEVQFFSEDNSTPYATWARCKEGKVIRAYAFRTDPRCEVLWNAGPTTEAERAAGFPYGDTGHEGPVEQEKYHDWLPHEEATDEISEAWGLNPHELKAEPGVASSGLAGTLRIPWGDAPAAETWPPKDYLSREEEMAKRAEIDERVKAIDPIHLLELYCEDRQIAFPETLREVRIESYLELLHAFAKLPNFKNFPVPEHLTYIFAGPACLGSLDYFRDRVRPRAKDELR